MLIAHPYYRFSHTDQSAGSSIARQRDDTTAHIADKGWLLADEYIDAAKSATTARHRQEGAELYRFEEEARSGVHHGKVLVVEKLDRLSRRGHDDTYDLIKSLGRYGVHIATVDGEQFYEAGKPLDMLQVLTILIKAEAARDEVEKKGARVRDAHKRRRELAEATGCAMGKLAPFWLVVSANQYVCVPDRVALVLRIFRMAEAGDGALTIAKKLNAEGVPVWQRWANRPVRAWDRTRVRKILADDAVLGWRKGKGDPLRIYPQIVPSELFERVRATAPVRSATKGGARSSVIANLVSGLATCDVCGSTMAYERKRAAGKPYRTRPAGKIAYLKHESAALVCRAAQNGGCRNRAGITYYGFERALLDAALHIALDDRAFVRTDELGRINALLADETQALRMASDRAIKLREAWADDSGSEMRRTLAEKAEAQAENLKLIVAALTEERALAAGQTSAEEHLGRIAEVRQHLHEPDLEVRRLHRKKVMEGLRSVISHIWCDEERTATVVFAGGLAALQIRGGKLVGQANAVRMFADGNFSSLGVPDRMARAVRERVAQEPVAQASSRAA
jgi:DNA invertase Pin-like site-specific DNA recombinase